MSLAPSESFRALKCCVILGSRGEHNKVTADDRSGRGDIRDRKARCEQVSSGLRRDREAGEGDFY